MESTNDTTSALDSLRRIFRVLRVEAAEKRLGVTAAQLFVLRALGDAPASSIRELAGRTLTDPSSVSVVVSRLVARRLVSRKPSPADARRAVLSLTPSGKSLLARAPLPPQLRLIAAIDELPAASRGRLAKALAELVGELGVAEGVAGMFFEPAARSARRRA